ncbi:sn-glycerol-1-phosphate dehydrogenase [Metabacillus malikii]|uniref:Glycerol-1-phosphate dehydrogenase [NAD(P)+] n=1 Tax=Metabacillus malikii TaxID=1504265 RepID=A0ABT9ZBU1_9BACI|nr:sn-glycerol-1-phosphate dehydrogenase [Metabacillus malikii]MDQ0229384.1 glycerol-1-phosphate dehydrogenase [NAD(P)+] [Metabacillus malikii]
MLSVQELNELAKTCTCGNAHYDCSIEEIVVRHNALQEAPRFIKSKGFNKVSIVADETTFNVAGERLVAELETANIPFETVIIQANEQGDVIANEVSLIEAMLGISQDTNAVIAVGAGTIHDISRFSSYKMGKPFISIPTAPSVDGFNSMGAPVVIKGVKTTFQMQTPIALFADIGILVKAPKKMIAAGFGDMIGKFTSLADWNFSHLIANEAYCALAADITRKALQSCVESSNQIAKADDEGIQRLIEALIDSGLAMLLVGHSSPASGGEHHLSHYWEMDFLSKGKKQVLHGAKVGISTQVILNFYKNQFLSLVSNKERLLALKANNRVAITKILDVQEQIIEIIDSLPSADDIGQLLTVLEGPTRPADIGIDDELVRNSLAEAHQLRKNRYTMLKFWNDHVGVHQDE